MSFTFFSFQCQEFKAYIYFRQSWKDLRLTGRVNDTFTIRGGEIDNIWTPDPYCYNARESNMMTPNEEVNVNVQISPNGNITSSRGYELVFLWGVILSCSVHQFPRRNNSTMMSIRERKNDASAPKRCGWDSLRHRTVRCFCIESRSNATMVSCLHVSKISGSQIHIAIIHVNGIWWQPMKK